jgi:hypothetical protein
MNIELDDLAVKVDNKEIEYLDLNVELYNQDLTTGNLVAINKKYAFFLESKDTQGYTIARIEDADSVSYNSVVQFIQGKHPFYYRNYQLFDKQHKKVCEISSYMMKALLNSKTYQWGDKYLYFYQESDTSDTIVFLYFPEGVYAFSSSYYTSNMLMCQINYFPKQFKIDDTIQEKLRSVKTLEEMISFLHGYIYKQYKLIEGGLECKLEIL